MNIKKIELIEPNKFKPFSLVIDVTTPEMAKVLGRMASMDITIPELVRKQYDEQGALENHDNVKQFLKALKKAL